MVQSEREAQERIRQRRYRRRRRRRRQRFLQIFTAFLAILALGVAVVLWGKRNKPQPSATETDPPITSDPVQADPSQAASKPPAEWEPITTDSWKLRLVNFQNPLPKDYSIQTVTLQNGLQVDERCYPDLQAMMDACRAEGLSPVICSAYRTWEGQEKLFQDKVKRLMEQGYSETDAETEAGTVVAVPGTSEHQLGLAVDIADLDHQILDESQENTEVQKWLMKHSWEYGFILRYPTGKSELTGIIYEPWHYRYVGKEDAEEIYTLGICLEEYLAKE